MKRHHAGPHSKCCTQCQVVLHVSYFGTRTRGGVVQPLSVCKACMRERWRLWNRNKRGGLRGYQRQNRCADPLELAQRVAEMAAKASPEAEGVRVYRLPSGEWGYWMGAIPPPKGSEFIGLYDFEAKPEYIAEDLAA